MNAGHAAGASDAPRVSVVMPVYNAARFLGEAIESVLGQTFPALELVTVDDASTDRSWEILQEHARRDPRVRPFRNERNLGIVRTRNRAFAEADPRSAYFAIMDSDDVCMPTRLERQVAFLDAHADHALVGGHNLVIDETSREIGFRPYPTTHDEIVRVMGRYNPISQPTATVRRAALDAVGRYDENFPRCQDYELWLRLAARYKVANLDEPTLKYRWSATQGKRSHMRETLKLTLRLQRRWMFRRPFFRPANVAYVGLEHLLLLLPEPVVLGLFRRVTYARAP
jgi:glycosyltransferase involved in cell wall biosynthesis